MAADKSQKKVKLNEGTTVGRKRRRAFESAGDAATSPSDPQVAEMILATARTGAGVKFAFLKAGVPRSVADDWYDRAQVGEEPHATLVNAAIEAQRLAIVQFEKMNWKSARQRKTADPTALRMLDLRETVIINIPGQGKVERRVGRYLLGGSFTRAERDNYDDAAKAFERAACIANDLDFLIRCEIARQGDEARYDPPLGNPAAEKTFDSLCGRLVKEIDEAVGWPIGDEMRARQCQEYIDYQTWKNLPDGKKRGQKNGFVIFRSKDKKGRWRSKTGPAFAVSQQRAGAFAGLRNLTLADLACPFDARRAPRRPAEWKAAALGGAGALALNLARMAQLFRDISRVVTKTGPKLKRKAATKRMLKNTKGLILQKALAEELADDSEFADMDVARLAQEIDITSEKLDELISESDLRTAQGRREVRVELFRQHFNNVRAS